MYADAVMQASRFVTLGTAPTGYSVGPIVPPWRSRPRSLILPKA